MAILLPETAPLSRQAEHGRARPTGRLDNRVVCGYNYHREDLGWRPLSRPAPEVHSAWAMRMQQRTNRTPPTTQPAPDSDSPAGGLTGAGSGRLPGMSSSGVQTLAEV
jgi:hypothetical protein